MALGELRAVGDGESGGLGTEGTAVGRTAGSLADTFMADAGDGDAGDSIVVEEFVGVIALVCG